MNLSGRNFEEELSFRSSRSGGKGGQNVNKVETKIELSFDVINSRLLNDEEKKKILSKLKNRIDKEGMFKIVSQSERSQFLNKTEAIKKFIDLISDALKKEKIRKKVSLSRSEKEKRLNEKKKLSVKKDLRKLKPSDMNGH